MTTPKQDATFRLGVAVYAASMGATPPESREELEAWIERLDADAYASIHGALDRAPYAAFAAAVLNARGSAR